MEIIKEFKRAGTETACAPMDFVKAVQAELPIFNHVTAEQMQARMKELFEGCHRWEYVVKEGDKTLAIIALTVDELDPHIGKPVIFPLMACSLEKGLLRGGYKWLLELAKEFKFEWILTTRTNDHTITTRYRPVKP